MENAKDKNSYSEFQFPQLNRWNPTKFSVELITPGAGRKLESRLTETVYYILESAPPELAQNLKPNEKWRIVVKLELEADWREKETENVVATFSGTYRAVFGFCDIIDDQKLQDQMREKAFRDFLGVQIYPLAKSHMNSQVGLLGITVNKRLGLNVYAESTTVESPIEENPVAPPVKKRSRKVASKAGST